MQIETAKVFCDLVETGSFTESAKRNGITQSAVSEQIATLERILGGPLRTAGFLCGAILGRAGHQTVLHLSACWGGLNKHKPRLETNLSWKNQMSPKLILPEDQTAAAPCRI